MSRDRRCPAESSHATETRACCSFSRRSGAAPIPSSRSASRRSRPLTLIAARTLIAGAILLAVLRWRGLRLPRDPATWRLFLVQACLNSVVPFTLIAWAERSVDAGLASILNANDAGLRLPDRRWR